MRKSISARGSERTTHPGIKNSPRFKVTSCTPLHPLASSLLATSPSWMSLSRKAMTPASLTPSRASVMYSISVRERE